MAEHTYPRREGDGISALYISQLRESTSSGTLALVKDPKEKNIYFEYIIMTIMIQISIIWGNIPLIRKPHHFWNFIIFCNCHLLCMMSQLPDSMKHSQADLYLETYQVLDLEMSRLREIQRWQASAASKVSIPCSVLIPCFFLTLQHCHLLITVNL